MKSTEPSKDWKVHAAGSITRATGTLVSKPENRDVSDFVSRNRVVGNDNASRNGALFGVAAPT